MRTAVWVLALLLPAIASAAEVELGSGAPPVKLKQVRDTVVLEYCPDNTCEVFSSHSVRSEVLKDFALMYLYGVSDYTYLREFQAKDLGPLAATAAARYRTGCARATPRTNAACVAAQIARKYAVTVQFVRYDEGQKHSSRVKWRR
jgi:hypothetical protein